MKRDSGYTVFEWSPEYGWKLIASFVYEVHAVAFASCPEAPTGPMRKIVWREGAWSRWMVFKWSERDKMRVNGELFKAPARGLCHEGQTGLSEVTRK